MFGKTPKGMSMDSVLDENLGRKAANANDPFFIQRMERKKMARECYLAEQASRQEAQAATHKRRTLVDWKPGDMVWYWRESGVKPISKHGERSGIQRGHSSAKGLSLIHI